MPVCKSCNSDAVVDISTSELACTVCGVVVAKNDVFQNESTPSYQCGLTTINNGMRHHSVRIKSRQDTTSRSQKLALGQLKNFAEQFRLDEHTLGGAERMLINALNKDCFHYMRADRKTMIIACCIYAALRNRGCGIQLSEVANKLQLQRETKLAFIYNKLKSTFPEDFSGMHAPGTSQLVDVFLSDTGLKDGGSNLAPCMKKILQLAEMELISTGVHSQPLLVAVSYVAWRSDSANVLQTLPFSKFCDMYELPKTKMCHKRLDEITMLLVKLCKGLPWIGEREITKKNVFPHVESVLAHSPLLAQESGPCSTEYCPRKKSRKRSLETEPTVVKNLVVSTSEELTNEDLSESEMDHYILTEEEVKEREDLLKHFSI